jgi:hypothetical protein
MLPWQLSEREETPAAQGDAIAETSWSCHMGWFARGRSVNSTRRGTWLMLLWFRCVFMSQQSWGANLLRSTGQQSMRRKEPLEFAEQGTSASSPDFTLALAVVPSWAKSRN